MSAVFNLCYRIINHHSRLYLHTPPNKSGIVTVFVWQGMNLLRSCENFEFLLRSASTTVVQIYQSVQQRLLALKILPPDSLASTHWLRSRKVITLNWLLIKTEHSERLNVGLITFGKQPYDLRYQHLPDSSARVTPSNRTDCLPGRAAFVKEIQKQAFGRRCFSPTRERE